MTHLPQIGATNSYQKLVQVYDASDANCYQIFLVPVSSNE